MVLRGSLVQSGDGGGGGGRGERLGVWGGGISVLDCSGQVQRI